MAVKLKITILSFYIILQSLCCQSDPIQQSKDAELLLNNYIDEIKMQTNNSFDKCENFAEYACNGVTTEKVKFHDMHPTELIEHYLINHGSPQNKAEKLIRDFYLTFKEFQNNFDKETIDSKNIFEQIHLFEGINAPLSTRKNAASISDMNKIITKLMAELNTLYLEIFFHFTIAGDRLILHSIGDRYSFREEIVKEFYTPFSNNSSEIQTLVNELNILDNKLKDLAENDNNDPAPAKLISVDELKVLFPKFNWDEYFIVLEENWSININKYKINIRDINSLKTTFQIINETDPDTLLNYIIYRISMEVKKFSNFKRFRKFNSFNILALRKRIFFSNFTPDFVRFYLNFLDDFELKLNKTVAEHLSHNIASDIGLQKVQNVIEEKRYVLNNYENLIPMDIFNEIYSDDLIIYPANLFYKNILPIMKRLIKYQNKVKDYDVQTQNTLRGYYDKTIEINIKNKPLSYYKTIIEYELWFTFLFYLPSSYDKVFEKCLPKNVSNLTSYVALKFTLLENADRKEIDKEKDFLINYVGLAQGICASSSLRRSEISLIFQHLDEFKSLAKCTETQLTDVKNVC